MKCQPRISPRGCGGRSGVRGLVPCAVIGGVAGRQNTSSALDTVSYNISLADPEQHLVEVQIVLPAGQAEHELQLPVWNALYQVRDFSQYVNWVRAKDRAGHPLSVRKLDKSRWEVTAAQRWSNGGV